MILLAFRLFLASIQSAWWRSGGARVRIAAPACWARTRFLTSRESRNSWLLAFFFMTLVAPAAWAQVTAAISGKVEDATGGAVGGATVAVKSLETGATRVVTTDERGDFRALSLPVGPQEVKAEKTGFKAAVRTGVNLKVGQE